MTKLFPNSPGNYYNHNPTSGYDQELIIITIIDPTRKDLKNKLSYFPIAQETITIIGPTRIDLKNKLSYPPNSPRNYHNHSPSQNNPKNKLSYSQLATQAYQDSHSGPKIFKPEKFSVLFRLKNFGSRVASITTIPYLQGEWLITTTKFIVYLGYDNS